MLWEGEITMNTSRQERVMAAKAAFGGENCQTFYPQESISEKGIVLRLGFIRFMASGMLLLLLLGAFASGFSYHGFNQDYVRERMEDETMWNHLEEKVQSIYVAMTKTSWIERIK
jgi:hypothetical protein